MTLKNHEALNDIRQLLATQSLGVLATRSADYPYATLVGFAASADLHSLFFATIRDTRKFQNILGNPQVSMLIDSRKHQAQDFKDAIALTVLGTAQPEDGPHRSHNETVYLKKHPYLRDFLKDPNCVFMRLDIHRYILVSRFQEVHEIDLP